MSNTIIKVEDLSKKYKIGSREAYYSLRDKISDVFNFKKNEKEEKSEFWALKDVNFEVKQGESIGIIGRNGAGKSTLLKVLSQITPPTTGKITMKGRVASLLEVGTGFNPELTGRENIFLNGAILGMTREEIKRKFDEIVAFAEIEQFLDTPVKRYSSGMYMRLAFSVAAHLESEILIVDEVLAVGDVEFQKKCLNKMSDVSSNEGRTVLFVSHNMEAIKSLCLSAIMLNGGKITKQGMTDIVVDEYLALSNKYENNEISIQILNNNDKWMKNRWIDIQIDWDKGKYGDKWECDFVTYSSNGLKLFAIQSSLLKTTRVENKKKDGIVFSIKNPGFSQRDIRVDIGVKKDPRSYDYDVILEGCLYIKTSDYNLPTLVHHAINEGVLIPEVKAVIY